MALPTYIQIRGARVHNLKDIKLDLPRHQLIVITGRSGSGKSSLAFDTIYAEGQRRYVESLSSYARQFVRSLEKPDVDSLEGLSPPVAIDQRSLNVNPRSTVGTMTEVYDHLRLLYAHGGQVHCTQCGQPLGRQTPERLVERIEVFRSEGEGPVILIVSFPMGTRAQRRQARKVFRREGWTHVFTPQGPRDIDEEGQELESWPDTSVDVVAEILRSPASSPLLLQRRVEQLLNVGTGTITVQDERDPSRRSTLTTHYYCGRCGLTLPPLESRSFSFNSPYGACGRCGGLGTQWVVDPSLVVPNKTLTLSEGAIRPLTRLLPHHSGAEDFLARLVQRTGTDLAVSFERLSSVVQERVLYGEHKSASDGDELAGGVIGYLEWKYTTTDSEYVKSEIERTMRSSVCPACDGRRLKPQSLAVTVGGKTINEAVRMPLETLKEWLETEGAKNATKPNGQRRDPKGAPERIVRFLVKEMVSRVEHLIAVGLEYLTLDRSVTTLAGGEAQRVRLATQLSAQLIDLVYVLDEPSIGLHQCDNAKLIATLKRLRDLGNTVIVVEHDEETIRSADYVVDMGPGAGRSGGEVVAVGAPADVAANLRSLTGRYLAGVERIPAPECVRSGTAKELIIHGARAFNLKNITVTFPLGRFICVTGVSGSGKSTLVHEILSKALLKHFYQAKDLPGEHDRLSGIEHLDKVITIDQSPIGRTPRSNPATYTGIFTLIRDLFIQVPEARARGLKPGNFSFNVRGGRCETCQGGGWVTVAMQFLPDMTVECEACEGRRYLPEILQIPWRGKNIAEVLDLTVEEALQFFQPSSEANTTLLMEKLSILDKVGLNYLTLGQPATTLSGGEAQRIKLATELSRRATGNTLYILDEPTTGLHADDIGKLLKVLQQLVDLGNTVAVIEHNMDVIKCADWVIDLGPGGGDKGGEVVGVGTPQDIAALRESSTGLYLKKVLESRARGAAKKANGR